MLKDRCKIFSEEGLYLALDLGGTNFRVLLLELLHGTPIREEVKKYHISSDLRVGSGIRLFDYLAECVSDFVISQGLQDVELPLGKLESIYITFETSGESRVRFLIALSVVRSFSEITFCNSRIIAIVSSSSKNSI